MEMESLGHQLIHYATAHPDLAVFVIGVTAFGESFAFLSLAFPGTAVLIAAGALVEAHALNPVAAVLAGSIGAILGDAISFWIGRKFGHFLPGHWPFRKHPKALENAMAFFKRYGSASVFIGRFFGPLRAVIPLAAGMMEMPVVPFYVANCLSAFIWAPALLFSGALLGHIAGRGEHPIALIGLVLAAATVLFYGARRLIRPS
jgi:membrane protein DedA with SNARE-associated domain